jgi:O-antigen/teichoic acid export membrane protein
MMGATPLLARLYGPEEFGALAVFSATYAIAIGLITLKYDSSIILPRDHIKAVDLTVLVLSISVILSLVLLAILGVCYFALGIPEHWYFLLVPFCTVLGAAYTCCQQWAARESDYRRFAKSQVMNSLTNVVTSVLLATTLAKLSGSLVLGFVTGMATGLIYLSIKHLRIPTAGWHLNFSFSRLITTGLEFRRFPMFVLPTSLLATLGLNVQPFLFQAMFSLQQVGFYAIANRLLMAPSALIGGAVAEAFRAEYVDRNKRGIENKSFFRNTLVKLFLLALPVYCVIFLTAPSLFVLILGDTYREAGLLARYLCIGTFAQFISQPFQNVFVATGNVRLGLLTQTVATALPIIAIIGGGISGSMETAVLYSALLTVLSSIILVGLAYRCCRKNDYLALNNVQ